MKIDESMSQVTSPEESTTTSSLTADQISQYRVICLEWCRRNKIQLSSKSINNCIQELSEVLVERNKNGFKDLDMEEKIVLLEYHARRQAKMEQDERDASRQPNGFLSGLQGCYQFDNGSKSQAGRLFGYETAQQFTIYYYKKEAYSDPRSKFIPPQVDISLPTDKFSTTQYELMLDEIQDLLLFGVRFDPKVKHRNQVLKITQKPSWIITRNLYEELLSQKSDMPLEEKEESSKQTVNKELGMRMVEF